MVVMKFLPAVAIVIFAGSAPVRAQTSTVSIVQPGAPGQPTKTLSAETRAKLPPISPKDVEFMQGMIMHHAQAVEMTDMISSRSENADVRLIGSRISQSQTDEMAFMKRWLELRGHSAEMQHKSTTDSHSAHGHSGQTKPEVMLMPGMLSPDQMAALKAAKGAAFDRLFLEGMIQHHEGALVMVKELFGVAGTAQDAEIYNFATDVDSGQRAEIKSMQNLLQRMNVKDQS
jgi:uncharacterized protein (DUF305 family)